MNLNVSKISQYSKSILIIFGIGLAILFFILIILFLLNKIKSFNKLLNSQKNYPKILINLGFGLILGVIFGFLSWTDYWQKIPIFSFINFSLLAVFAYRFSLWIFLGAFVPESIIISFLFIKLMPNFKNNTYISTYLIYIVFAYLIFVLIGIFLKIFGNKKPSLFIFVSSSIGFICLFFLIWLVMKLKDAINSFSFFGIISLDILFSWIAFLIYYFLLKIIINFYKSYQDILKSGNYAEPGIPNQKYGIYLINRLINNKNLNFGYLITLKFINEDEIIVKYGLSAFYKIKKQWKNFLLEHFPLQPNFLFLDNNHNYCLFIGFQQLDEFNEENKKNIKILIETLNKYLIQMPQEVVYNNQLIKLSFVALIALYNIHSQDINKLIDFNNNSYLIHKNQIHKNKIYLFNPKKNFVPFLSWNDAQKLDQIIKGNSFEIKFFQENSNTLKKLKILSADFWNLNLLIFTKKELYELAIKNKILDILLQYLAQIELKKASKLNLFLEKNNRIIIDYSWMVVNQKNFDINLYLNKLDCFQIQPYQIILNFNLKNFDQDEYSIETVSIALQQFQQNNIKIAFSGIDEINIKFFKYFIPNYVLFDEVSNNAYYRTLFDFLKQKKVEIIF